jgi:hypothetical protein
MSCAAHGGEGMACAGHGVVTPSPSRPSLSPGGVAPAPRRPSSAHALPTLHRFSSRFAETISAWSPLS